MKKAFLAFAAGLMMSTTAMAANLTYLSFQGKASLEQLKTGTLKSTIRLGDRTGAPTFFKVGQVVPLVNGDEKEDARKYEEQIKANAYGKVEIAALKVSKFEALSPADQKEFAKYYTPEKIKEAGGVVSVITLKYQP